MKVTFKKTAIGILTLALVGISIPSQKVEAYDFSDESYWIKVCSGYITNQDTYNACMAFKQYASDKANDYNNAAGSLQSKIDQAQGKIDDLIEVSKQYSAEIESKESEIGELQASINTAQASIDEAARDIEKKAEDIKARRKIVSKQMVEMQANINTNQFLDFIMGAKDLVDMVQRSSGIESITKNQKEQIAKLKEDNEKLELAKKEQIRIKSTLEIQRNSIEAAKVSLVAMKKDSDSLKLTLEEDINKMLAERNAANSAAQTLANMKMPSFSTSGGSADVGDVNSSGFLRPVNAPLSGGIGSYPGHIGADYAAPRGTPVVAPADCYVVYANNIYTNDNGNNLGNMVGTPSGGGNSIRLIFSVNGQTFAMNIYHMTTNMPAVSYNGTGVAVPQGTLLGHVGSSGNSSGPHAHIELLTLSGTVQQEIATWYNTGDWQSGCGWNYTPVCGGSGACRVNPASYF